MKLYSDIPVAARCRWPPTSGSCCGWCSGCASRSGCTTRRWRLAVPGRNLAGAGSSFRDTMTTAGDNVDDLPLLDDRVATPFRSAAGVGTEIEKAGTDLVTAVERMSLLLALTTALCRSSSSARSGWCCAALRAPRQRRAAVHRRRPRPRPVRAAGDGEPADAAPGQDLRRPGRRVAAWRPRRHPRPGPARAQGRRPAPAPAFPPSLSLDVAQCGS